MTVRNRILDACDLETFLLCGSLDEGRQLGQELMRDLGFRDVDVVSCEMGGPGVRIRLRGYVNRPSGSYTWRGFGGEPK